MKCFLTLVFVLSCSICFCQQQWFPVKFDTIAKNNVADTSGAFPVCFIKIIGTKAFMYGHHTHYPTLMKRIGSRYFSSYLIMPKHANNSDLPYINAEYFFNINGDKGKLILKFATRTDTIIFIKSAKPFNDINARWG